MNDMALEYAQHRFTVDEYHRMDDAGVFAPDAHIELIDGELVERLVSMKPPHASVVAGLDDLIRTVLPDGALVRCQLPITLGNFSEPEPDLAIVSGSRSRYRARHPTSEDVLCIIEVADTTRDFDVRRKVPIYAEFAISETWVVDLLDSCIRLFRDPIDGLYRNISVARDDDRVALLAYPEMRFGVSEILN